MNDDRWSSIVGQIKDNFGITRQEILELTEDDGPGTIEIIEFTGPVGNIKLERVTKPMIINRKSLGSKRIGSDKVIEYTYSDTEKTHTFTAFKENNNGDWEEIKLDRGEMIF